MRRYKNNPRQITKKAFTKLGETLDEFGDLSIIVHDLNSDQIIGGNQRSTVFGGADVSKIEPVITEQFDPPTRTGTVAVGYVEWHGERYFYRAVRWTEQQCAEANIIANTAGGQWDADLIAGWPVETLTKAGWDADLLKSWNADGAILASLLRANRSDEYAGLFQDENAAPADNDAPASAQDKARFPLAIVLTSDERREWDAFKKTLGVKEDKTAFIRLLEAVDHDDA